MNSDYIQFLKRAVESHAEPAIFVAESSPVSSAEISSVESALGTELPMSYRGFVTTLGPGIWCGEIVMAPSALYAFDSDCGEMEGFIALVGNVQGVGDYLAINPADPTALGERPLYYCGHDPFGYARLTDSFEAWTRNALVPQNSGESPYAVVEQHFRTAQPKQWWQFWRG